MQKWLVGLFLLMSGVLFSGCSVLELNAKGGLQVITSDGVPAQVYLDGKLADKTPYINKELKPGEYTLQIKPDDPSLATYETKVSVKNKLLTFVTWKLGNRPETSGGSIYELEKLTNKKNSELSITTIPDGSIVKVDGKAQGFSPVLLEQLNPGEHVFEVSLPSYEMQKNTININQGYRMNVTVKIPKQEYKALETASTSSQTVISTSSAGLTASPTPPASKIASASAETDPSVPKPKVHITPTDYFVDGKESLNVRKGPAPDSGNIGVVYSGKEYPYLNEYLDGWYKINFNGQTGWVSGQYVQLIK